MMLVLTGIDVLGIQGYVFASNRLRDVLAASWMVEHVASREQLEQWPGQGPSNVLLASGGTAILEFDSLASARRWTALYSRWLQDTAPGLEVVVAHRCREGRPLAWALKALQVDLARAKLERRPSVPQLGLSVTAPCAVTGLPATAVDDARGDPVSPRVQRLRERVEEAKGRWNADFLPALEQAPGWTPEFPAELDLMGRTHGEASLLGVVHVDGNGVGKAIRHWLDRCIEEDVADAEVQERYRAWSRGIIELGKTVLRTVAQRAAECARQEEGRCFLRGTPHDLGFRLYDWRDDATRRTAENTVFLPLRPILLGGDDLTFVCDGRVALDLAVTALKAFEGQPIPHLGEDGQDTPLSACAGVALVKAHAPFHRSYELVEDLCRSAKRARLEANDPAGCWLDWHLGSTRPGESVEDVRQRQYRSGRQSQEWISTLRPYPLAGFDSGHQSWEWLDKELLGPGELPQTAKQGFRGAECWTRSRSRVKHLSSLARHGPAEIERQLEAWKGTDSAICLPGGLDDSGYRGNKTPLRDAIELMDQHLRLEPDPRVPGKAPGNRTAGAAAKEGGSS